MTIHHPARFQIHWWNQDQIDQQLQVQPPTEAVVAPTPSTTAPERLLNRLDYQYPYSKATQTTSYQSVSELKRLYNDPDDQDITLLEWHSADQKLAPQRFRYVETELAKPRFTRTKPQAASIGSATHLVMQMLPLTGSTDGSILSSFYR